MVAPEVRGKANLKLTKVPWDQVIEILCKDNHLYNKKEGNILSIDVIVYDLPEGLGLGKAKRITVDYKNVEMREILKDLSKLTGFSIDADPDVKGRVSFRATNVPWLTVIKQIADENDWAVKIEGKKVYLAPPLSMPGQKAEPGEPFSFDFDDIDIKDFFAFVGDISGRNFVLDPEVKGPITIHIVEMPWEEAVRVVCKNNNLGYTVSGSNIRIAPIAKLKEEEKQNKYLPEISKEIKKNE